MNPGRIAALSRRIAPRGSSAAVRSRYSKPYTTLSVCGWRPFFADNNRSPCNWCRHGAPRVVPSKPLAYHPAIAPCTLIMPCPSYPRRFRIVPSPYPDRWHRPYRRDSLWPPANPPLLPDDYPSRAAPVSSPPPVSPPPSRDVAPSMSCQPWSRQDTWRNNSPPATPRPRGTTALTPTVRSRPALAPSPPAPPRSSALYLSLHFPSRILSFPLSERG